MNYALTITTAPAAEPVSTAEAKAHCNVTISTDDTYIDTLITAARVWAEQFTRRTFITTVYSLKLDGFPANEMRIPLPPLTTTNFAVSYLDTAGTSTNLTVTTDYIIDTASEPGRLAPAWGKVWPVTRGQFNDVTIAYTAGYGSAGSSVPGPIKHAIKILVSHWYEHRETIITGTIVSDVPQSAEALLWPYRVWEAK